MTRHLLAVVAKQPAAGQTKTRLCPPLSAAVAAELYTCFLQDTLGIMRAVPDVTRAIAYLPDTADQYFRTLAPDMQLISQHGESLGERLNHLITDALASGMQQVVVMDSDSPTLPPAYVQQAFELLQGPVDAVFGPCHDGGYYLVGMNRPCPRLLREVQMSTSHVLADTLALAAADNVRFALLPAWYDVDTSAELDMLRTELASATNGLAPHTRSFLAA